MAGMSLLLSFQLVPTADAVGEFSPKSKVLRARLADDEEEADSLCLTFPRSHSHIMSIT